MSQGIYMTTCSDFFYSAEHKIWYFEECWTLKKIIWEMFFLYIFFYTLVSGHQDCLVTKIINNIDNTLQ